MFKIYNGGEYFYQWDLGQRLIMDEPFTKVHYCNRTGDCALVCETYEEDGVRLVHVPNILLQDTANIRVYGVYEEGEEICYSKCMQIFRVISRGKPDSYVYTEDEVMSWTVLEARVNEGLEQTGYYVPTVDSDGNLSWDASKESLPAVETVNIKGEKGDKGDTGEVSLAYADQHYTSFDYANSTFANVLKGNKSGEAIGITDISPLEHEMSVKVRGKNLLNPIFSGYLWVLQGNNATITEDTKGYSQIVSVKPNTTYTISGDFTGANTNYVRIGFTEEYPVVGVMTIAERINNTSDIPVKTFTTPSNCHYLIICTGTSSVYDYTSGKPQLEEGDTATEYTPYVDISDVSVSKYGKNLYKPTLNTQTTNGVTVTRNEDNSYTVNGTATTETYIHIGSISVPRGYEYYVSGGATNVDLAYQLRDGSYQYDTVINKDGVSIITKTHKGYSCDSINVVIRVAKGTTVKNAVVKPMIAFNSDSTYEPYIEPTSYPVAADGTVEGVAAIYPNTTLIASTGAVIDCEYNKDINKAFAELEEKLTQAIISLGNNI